MRKPLTVIIVTLSVVCTLKGMSRWLIQRIKAMLLYVVYGILFVDTVNTRSLVFVALTQHLIQSTMRCENYSTLYKVVSCPCQKGRLYFRDILHVLLKTERIHVDTVEMCLLPIVQHQYQMNHLYVNPVNTNPESRFKATKKRYEVSSGI